MEESERSFVKIETCDLERLALLSKEDREKFFSSYPRWQRLYADRILCIALCQGAALHYIDEKNGVKDFDVWTFYAAHPDAPFPTGPSYLVPPAVAPVAATTGTP